MVAPVKGPFVRSVSHPGPPSNLGFTPIHYTKYQSWYTQAKPKQQPLAYVMRENKVVAYHRFDGTGYRSVNSAPAEDNSAYTNAINKAYSSLTSQLRDESLWAVNLAEHRKSEELLFGAASKLFKFARAVKRFDFVRAAKILRVEVPKGLKPKAKAFGNNYLAYHFGAEPLYQDIGRALYTLTDPLLPKAVCGKGRSNSSYYNRGGGANDIYQSKTTRSYVKMGCLVEVTNPNLYRAENMGFINPYAVAWELVPFSFVVDWLINLDDIISSWTMGAGAATKWPYTTRYQVLDTSSEWHYYYSPGGGAPVQKRFLMYEQYQSVYMTRSLALTQPILSIRPWKAVSMTRAATVISLLTKLLR